MPNSVFKFLNEDKSRCEFKGKELDVSIDSETNEKYFIYKESEVYFIIENEKQMIRRIELDNQEIDFQRCIFIYKDIEFFNYEVKKVINFNYAVFCEEVNFGEGQFASMIFKECIFEKDISFSNIKFKGIIKFNKSNFKNQVFFFDNCHFYESIEARNITSEKDFYFSNVTFDKALDFSDSRFKEKLLFKGDNNYNSNEELNLSGTTIKELDLGNMNKGNSFLISFATSYIEDINYMKTDFTYNNVKDRKTFLILKQFAIKKHDHINALNFYKNEMQMHTKQLRKEKENKLVDYWILKFEEVASNFGTNPIRPIILIFCISFVFSFFISFFTNSLNVYFENSLLLINPTLSVKDILHITLDVKDIFIPPLLEIFNFFKNIIFGILIYETIKSFRKFSRKL
ncbi:hypothetical protein CRV00_07775 [Malaciobacter molluscorum]|uniref:hypothetical protein n=1 Tax=Malaciobacter molluscorum TaxID=1032072 RepID=UPI00100B66D9|nr:hypothetical protein [Malaciobacter molluscorum]RXJ94118.1 hypothetical protein CRV00_07775 [Malaciobacter molluscorum]